MALIGSIRERAVLMVVVIALALLAFLLMDVLNSSQSAFGGDPTAIGSIDGETISAIEYDRQVRQALDNEQRNSPGSLTDRRRLQIRESVWNNYTQDLLAKKEYRKLGLAVTQEERLDLFTSENAHPSVKGAAAFKDPDTQQFDPELVVQYIKSMDDPQLDPAQAENLRNNWRIYEDFIVNDQMKKKYSGLVKQGIYMPSWFVSEDHNNKNKQASVEYVNIPYTNVTDDQVSFTDSDLSAYLNANRTKFTRDANRSMDYITFPIQASGQDSTDAEVMMAKKKTEFSTTKDDSLFVKMNSDGPYNPTFTATSKFTSSAKGQILGLAPGSVYGPYLEGNSYKLAKMVEKRMVADSVRSSIILRKISATQNPQQAKATIDSIKNVLNAGGDFEALASKHSEDTSNGSGGDRGWATSSTFSQPYTNAIFYEGVPGDVMVRRVPQGWAIIRIDEATANNEAVKVIYATRNIEASSRTRDDIFAAANQFASMNRDGSNFAASAEQQGYTVASANNVKSSQFDLAGLGVAEQLVTWLNKSFVGDVSQAYELDDKFVVATNTAINPEGLQSVEAVRSELETEVLKQKKAEYLISQVSGSDLSEIAAANNTTVKTADNVNFAAGSISGLGSEPKVNAVIFGLDQGQVSSPIVGNRGVILVKPTSFTDASELTDIDAQRTTVTTALRGSVNTKLLPALTKSVDFVDNRYVGR